MPSAMTGFRKILVATDFSPHADSALQQSIWLARQSGAQIVLVHTVRDLRRAMLGTSYQARLDFLYGPGDLFQQELRRESDTKMRQLIVNLNAPDLDVQFETILGEPFVQVTHAVQAEGYDLVLAGTRGMAAWKEFLLGSTAQRLIRNCPASVWIAKAGYVSPPKIVLAATDFSEVSLKAVTQGLWVAQQAQAEFHLLHVIDSLDVPDDLISKVPKGNSLRDEINAEATKRLDEFLDSLQVDRTRIHLHSSWGTPWKEVGRTAQHLPADLIVIGTVGRSGIQGVFLGNTAEKVLSTCDCSVLTVKPDGFVSPIDPAFWPLHARLVVDNSTTAQDAGA